MKIKQKIILNKFIKLKTDYAKLIIQILLILLLGLVLRMHNLDTYCLWYDEAIRALDGKGLHAIAPLYKFLNIEFITNYNHDYLMLYNHGFAYYWKKIYGDSEFALRASSVIIGIITIYFLFIFCQSIFDPLVAKIASLLLAISPFHIYYSQDFGPYIFLPLFSLAAFYALSGILKTGRPKYWFFYGINIIFAVYFHCTMLISLISFLCIFIVLLRTKRINNVTYFSLSHIIIFILLIPIILTILPLLLYTISGSTYRVAQECPIFPFWIEKVTWKQILFTIKNFIVGYNLKITSPASVILIPLYLFFFIWGACRYRSNYKKFILFYFAFPITLLFLISQFKIFFVYRYLFFLLPFFIIMTALGLSQIKAKYLSGILLIIGFLHYFCLKDYYANILSRNYGDHIGIIEKTVSIDEVAQFLSQKFKEGDRIFHVSGKTVFPLKFYIHRNHNLSDLIKEIDKGSIIFLSEDRQNLMYFNLNDTHPRLADLYSIRKLEHVPRVWVILASYAPRTIAKNNFPEYAIIDFFRKNYKAECYQDIGDIAVYLFSSG